VSEEAKKNPEQWVVQRFQKLLDSISVIVSGYWEVQQKEKPNLNFC